MKALKVLVQSMVTDGHDSDEIVAQVREAIDELIGSYPDGEQPRFNFQQLDDDLQLDGIKETYQEGQLYGIVDEDKGGFIGYAIGEEHADLMSKALVITKGTFWEL